MTASAPAGPIQRGRSKRPFWWRRTRSARLPKGRPHSRFISRPGPSRLAELHPLLGVVGPQVGFLVTLLVVPVVPHGLVLPSTREHANPLMDGRIYRLARKSPRRLSAGSSLSARNQSASERDHLRPVGGADLGRREPEARTDVLGDYLDALLALGPLAVHRKRTDSTAISPLGRELALILSDRGGKINPWNRRGSTNGFGRCGCTRHALRPRRLAEHVTSTSTARWSRPPPT